MTTNVLHTAATNPFASRHIDRLRFRFNDLDWGDVSARLDTLGGRGAIVGQHGSGKTTCMHQLGEHFKHDAWTVHHFRTTLESNLHARLMTLELGPHDAVLLDGAGHIGPVMWRRVLRAVRGAGRFVITAHRPGRLATLHDCKPSLRLLDALIAELAPAHAADLRQASHTLYQCHHGNIRNVFRGLYDHCAGLS